MKYENKWNTKNKKQLRKYKQYNTMCNVQCQLSAFFKMTINDSHTPKYNKF